MKKEELKRINEDQYFIVVKNLEGTAQFLDFDEQSGGYPYWSEYNKKPISKKACESYLEVIKKDARKRSGEYFNQQNDYTTLTLVQVGVISIEHIDFNALSDNEIRSLELNKKLSSDDIKFIKENM